MFNLLNVGLIRISVRLVRLFGSLAALNWLVNLALFEFLDLGEKKGDDEDEKATNEYHD
jgi:hypothetical protein